MPSYPVLQPDGQLAVWSTIADHFTAFDCTPEKAAGIIERNDNPHFHTVFRCKIVQRGEKPFMHWQDWDSRVAWAIATHGEDEETVLQAMERTPDQTIVQLHYRVIMAEREIDELRFRLDDAIAAKAKQST